MIFNEFQIYVSEKLWGSDEMDDWIVMLCEWVWSHNFY